MRWTKADYRGQLQPIVTSNADKKLQYATEVGDGTFPGTENYSGIKDEEYNELIKELGE